MLRNYLALQLAIGILGALFVYGLLVGDDDRRRRRRRGDLPKPIPPHPVHESDPLEGPLPWRRNGHKVVPMPTTAVHPLQRGR